MNFNWLASNGKGNWKMAHNSVHNELKRINQSK